MVESLRRNWARLAWKVKVIEAKYNGRLRRRQIENQKRRFTYTNVRLLRPQSAADVVSIAILLLVVEKKIISSIFVEEIFDVRLSGWSGGWADG